MDIRRINTNKDFLGWDEWEYDCWEMFDEPKGINACEIFLAIKYLNMMKIDIDQQDIITFRATPSHFANMIIRYIRLLQHQHPKIFAKNFCDDIEPDL